MATCETSDSSLNDFDGIYGHLLFFRKGGGPGLPYSLTVGETTIGYSLDADIRIKIQDDRLEEIHCIVEVAESGVAKLINKSSSNTVLVNHISIDKFIILHNKDTVDVIGKSFQYINENISDEEIKRFERSMLKSCRTPLRKRQTIAPLLSLKSSTPYSDVKAMVSFALSTHNRMRRSSNAALKIVADKRLSLPDQAKLPLRNRLKNKENFRRSASASIPMEKRNSTVANDRSIKPSLSEITISDVDDSPISKKSLLKTGSGEKRRTSSRKSASMSHIFSDVSTEFLSSNSFVVEASLISDDLEKTELQNSSMFSSTPKSVDLRPSLRSSTRNGSKLENIMKTMNESTTASMAGTVDGSTLDSTPKLQDSKSPPLLTLRKTRSPHNDLNNISGAKGFLKIHGEVKSPKNELTNIAGVKKLLATPKYTKSPRNDLTDITGVKKLLRTPRQIKSPINDLTNVVGVKKLLATPKPQKSPKNDLTNIAGVKRLLTTPKYLKSPQNDLSNIVGVKKLLRTPRQMKSPRNDLTNVIGVKKLLVTPKSQKSPKNDLTNIAGLKRLLSTPKFPKSPKNDLTNVGGVKKLLRTPRHMKSPKNDLTNVGGLKKLLSTPKQQKSPKNDLTNIAGVKELLATPKYPKSPQNDLTEIFGVKKLLKTPRQIKSPRNDLTDIYGVKKLFSFPKQQKSPKNDLTEVAGVRKLLRTPKEMKSPKNALDDLDGVAELYEVHNSSKSGLIDHNNLFDKLLNKKPLKTYRAQSISPLKNIHGNMRRKTMGDVSTVTSPRVASWVEEQKAIIRHQSTQILVDEVKPLENANPVSENIVKTPELKGERIIRSEPVVHIVSELNGTRKGRSLKVEDTDNIDESTVVSPMQPVVRAISDSPIKGEEATVTTGDEEEKIIVTRRGRLQRGETANVKERNVTGHMQHVVRRESQKEECVDEVEKPISTRRGRLRKRELAESQKEECVDEVEKPISTRRGRLRKGELAGNIKESNVASPAQTVLPRESQKEECVDEVEKPISTRRGRLRKRELAENQKEECVDEFEKPISTRRGRLRKRELAGNIKESNVASPAQTVLPRESQKEECVDEVEKPISTRSGRLRKRELAESQKEECVDEVEKPISTRRGRLRKRELAGNIKESNVASPAQTVLPRESQKEESVDEVEKPISTRRGTLRKRELAGNIKENYVTSPAQTVPRVKLIKQEEQSSVTETVEIGIGRRTRRNRDGIKQESSDDNIRTRKVKTEFNKYGEDFVHESPLKKKNTRRKN